MDIRIHIQIHVHVHMHVYIYTLCVICTANMAYINHIIYDTHAHSVACYGHFTLLTLPYNNVLKGDC